MGQWDGPWSETEKKNKQTNHKQVSKQTKQPPEKNIPQSMRVDTVSVVSFLQTHIESVVPSLVCGRQRCRCWSPGLQFCTAASVQEFGSSLMLGSAIVCVQPCAKALDAWSGSLCLAHLVSCTHQISPQRSSKLCEWSNCERKQREKRFMYFWGIFFFSSECWLCLFAFLECGVSLRQPLKREESIL